MTDKEKQQQLDNIAKGIISYFGFVNNFKKIHEDEAILKEADNPNSIKYLLRKFDTECYLIDKKNFDDFKSAINFGKLTQELVINEENKSKIKEELGKYLNEHPYQFNAGNIKIYSEFEEMKTIVKNFTNYSFVNKEILCDAMGISEKNLKEKMMKVSKNKNDTCIISNNFSLIVPKKKVEEKKEIQKYKNLYYVENITKKIFTLLHFFNEDVIPNKINNKIKDDYYFKTYYLINDEWMNRYKNFFSYDFIIKKLKKKLEKKNERYTYKKVKYYLDDIIKEIGQIELYGESSIDNYLRDAKNLIPEMKKRTRLVQQETPDLEDFYTPNCFCLINKDIFELLQREQFFYNMDDSVKDIIEFKILIGNGTLIVKNKMCENQGQNINEKLFNSNEYLFYVENKNVKFLNENDPEKDETFILYYLLNYDTKNESPFFHNLNTLNENKGFEEFTKELNIKDFNFAQNIIDKNGNYLGNFIIFRHKEEIINFLTRLNFFTYFFI